MKTKQDRASNSRRKRRREEEQVLRERNDGEGYTDGKERVRETDTERERE